MKYKLFSDCSDLEGVENVNDILYIHLMSYHLDFFCGWPEELGIYKKKVPWALKHHGFFATVISLPLLVLYVMDNVGKQPLLVIGHSYITVMMSLVSTSRLCLVKLKKYTDFTVDFIESFHMFHHRHTSDYAMKTHLLVHRLSHFFTMYVTLIMFNGFTLFNIVPIYINYATGAYENFTSGNSGNKSFEPAIYYKLPFDYEHDTIWYLIMFVYNYYVSYLCTATFCVMDIYMTVVVIHLWGHLSVLKHDLENFLRPKTIQSVQFPQFKVSVEYYTEEEQLEVYERLKGIINYQKVVTSFSDKVSGTFGEVIFIYFGFHQIVCTLLLLESSQMDFISFGKYGPLTFFFYQQLIQLSVSFEYVASMGEQLIVSAYNLPWQCMNTKNRKICLFLLQKIQIPLNVKAMGMLGVGVQTMQMILKNTITYYVMLKTVA